MTDWGKALDFHIDTLHETTRTLRRHLHMHPEPSGQEFQTTIYLAERLKEYGIQTAIPDSGRGVLADSTENQQGSCVAIRADMDALYIHEQTDVSYRSRRDGVMHACGHDAHSAMVFCAALALKQMENELPWPCPWRAIFQPAEETAEGALEMIEAGALENVRRIISLHVDPDRLTGRVGLRHGEITAHCQDFKITIKGQGGHAARPHQAVDPIAAAVHFIGDVYRFVPRSVDARDPVVVTFGIIRGGEVNNAIPEQVYLEGTIRTLTRTARSQVENIIERIRKGVMEITGAAIQIEVANGPDGVYNDRVVTDQVWQAASAVVSRDYVEYIERPSMGGEDFAAYLDHVPGCLMRLGVAKKDQPQHFLHSPLFEIDEDALAIGAKILARSVVLLSQP